MKPINTYSINLIDSKRLLNYAVLALLVVSQTSCFQHFYKTNSTVKVDSIRIKELNAEQKYFIIHTPAEVFALKNLRVDGGTVSGDREAVDRKYEKYLYPKLNNPNRFPKREKETVFSQVHLYIKDTVDEKGQVKLGINQIFRADIYESDKAADKRSKTDSIVGIVAVPLIGLGILVIVGAEIQSAFSQ